MVVTPLYVPQVANTQIEKTYREKTKPISTGISIILAIQARVKLSEIYYLN